MKKKYLSLLLLLISCFTSVKAQTVDLEGYLRGRYMVDGYLYLSWIPNSQEYSFVKSGSRDTLFIRHATQANKNRSIPVSQLRKALPDQRINAISPYEWITRDELYFPYLHAIIGLKDKELTAEILPLEKENVISADAANRLFITKEENGNVFVRSNKNGYQKIIISTDTGRHIVFGESVHRSEWGINEGQYISPKANYIAFYRMDENMVEDYPLVNTGTSIATVENIKYPMAGRKSHTVKVGIFDVAKSITAQQPVFHYIKTEMRDGEFLTNVTFSPDESRLYITHVNRAQNEARLVEYEVATGNKLRIVLEEKDEKYVEPQHRMHFLKNGRFIWQSDRDGWNHCYLYDLSGKMIKQLTSGNWDVMDLIGTDPKEEYLYFMTNKDMPVDLYLYRINMNTGTLRNMTPESGYHNSVISSDYQYFIDRQSSIHIPQITSLYNISKGKKQVLHVSKNPYSNENLGNTSIFTIRNKNKDDLYCRMITPPDFDSTKKYPCLIYVYGGPHSQLVTNTFLSGGAFLQYLAQKGYVVFTLDNRGTANRGADFEKSIHRQLGVLETEDQLCGVSYLKSLPFIDENRIGLDGWSYGGFMVLTLVADHPGLFRSASCGGPVVDWKWYEVMYGERYMDTPEENPEGYKNSSIIPKVKNIKSHLLVMHGAQDHTVVWQHSLELLRQAVADGVQVEYFVYPDHDHNVIGKDRVHLWKKIEKFHDTYLK